MRLGLDLYSRRSGSAASFPWDLPSLIAWFNASEASTITQSSGDVSRWDSQGGSNYAEQTASGDRPVTGTRTLNSVNALDFVASEQDHMDISSPISDYSSGATLVSVFNVDSLATQRPLLGGIGIGAFGVTITSAGAIECIKTRVSTVLSTADSLISTGTNYIVAVRSSSAGTEIYINGTSAATNATNPNYSDGVVQDVGTTFYFGSSYYFDGLIGISGLFSEKLSDADLNTIANAAASEYGLTWADI